MVTKDQIMFARRLMVCVVISLGTPLAAQTVAAQNLRESARRQLAQNPGRALLLPAPPADYLPKSVEELTTESDVVVQARLVEDRSYLSRNEDYVLTDYRIQAPQIIAGRPSARTSPVPGQGTPLTLTVFGGDVMLEGVLVRAIDNNREPIKNGGQYLLFLKEAPGGQPGQYWIYYGGIFELLDGGRLDPLMKAASRVFHDAQGVALKEMVERIQAAKRVR